MKKGILRLRDGKEFKGTLFGSCDSLASGEVVFNTGIPGYGSILTDPSYNGQLVVLTGSMIGNYGISKYEEESSGVKAAALIVRRLYRGIVGEGRLTLDEYLKREGIVGIEDLDTRALTIYLREHGAEDGIIFCEKDRERALESLNSLPSISERNLIEGVATKVRVENPIISGDIQAPNKPILKTALIDFGVKFSIIRELYKRGSAVVLLPPTFTAEDVIKENPDIVFLSNGPGDPELLTGPINEIKGLLGRYPIRGICLGHQLITHALGGRTVKMKFGHHGSNSPVHDLITQRTFVTAQNHGFMSDPSSLSDDTTVWMENLNDGTIEGIINEKRNTMSVQFHPEAGPGPEEARYIFDCFIKGSAK